MRHRLASLTSLASLLCLTQLAAAHTITVDGLDDEWLPRQPIAADLGMIVRNASGHGELVWRDASSDARTLLSNPENEADMKSFRVTGDADNVYFLVGLPDAHSTTPVQVQIAIDLGLQGAISTFLSGSETQLSVGGSANFIVRTSFANPFVANAGAQVSNKDQTVLASVPTQFGADGVELSVPWTLFGLKGPPTGRVRFHVATFRAQTAVTTVEVAGSDALDVLSDYGDPRGAVAGPGTGAELDGDNRVDDYIEAHFSPSGEVYAPLLIERFVSNGQGASARNWVALRNMTSGQLDSQQFKLGDSEMPDDGEGMSVLPLGTIAGKAEYVVATHGAEYAAFFGKTANAEIVGNSAATPDAPPFLAWADGGMTLATAGDELVLLDATNTLLDVVVYGNGSYSGITALTPTPASDVVSVRSGKLGDSDDCSKDFSQLGAQCSTSATCGSCKVCSENACVNAGAGASCADANACNGNETCDGKGACQAGTAPNCNDQDPCTSDSCHAVSGCQHASASAGTKCDDQDACTSGDSCNGAGACKGSPLDCVPPAPSCESASVSVKYTGGACAAGTCEFTKIVTKCANGCGASGLCNGDPCDGLKCEKPPSQCSYFTGICKEGNCDYDPKAVGSACDDGDPCTALDACDAKQGCAGIPVQCNTPPAPSCVEPSLSRSYKAVGVCKEGGCDYEYADQKCANGCSERTGLCESDPCGEISCDSPPGACFSEVGTCKDGVCSYAERPLLAVCDDGDACTSGDTCDGRGSCGGQADPKCEDPCAGVTCDAPPSDCYAARGSCDGGTCSYAPRALAAPCDDGDACTGADACDGAGTCAGTTLAECMLGEGGAGGADNAGGSPSTDVGGDTGKPDETPAAGAPSSPQGEGGASDGMPGGQHKGGDAADPAAESSADPGGCSCRMVGASRSAPLGSSHALWLLGLVGFARWRNRRRAA